MDQQTNSSHLTARLFDFVDIHPAHIHHTYYNTFSARLYVSRKNYSQVYSVTLADDPTAISIQQLLVLQPCQRMFEIDGMMVMVFSFELKICTNGKWIIYPFTTQLLPASTKLDKRNNKLYTFHINECCEWTISQEDGVNIKYLAKNQTPFHINSEGSLQGYGKKIKPSNLKQDRFNVLESSDCGKFLFIGSSRGQLHIYQTKYLTHVMTFHRHQGAILTILYQNNICYFSGSDSKVSSIVYVQNEQLKTGNWVLSKQVRAQSHDILTISLITQQDNNKNFLISGGITTDICLYKLTQALTLTDQWCHKISYCSTKQCHLINDYLIANKYNSFEIWKVQNNQQMNDEQGQEYEQNNQLNEYDNKSCVQLIVKYQPVFYKSIRFILAKKDQDTGLLTLFVATQDQATLWSFDQHNGLLKLLTVKNHYDLASWFKRDGVVTVREGHKLQVFNYKTGSIQQIADLELQHPTDIKLCQRTNKILIGSKISQQVEGYQIIRKQSGKKTIKKIIKLDLQNCYNVLDFCYSNPQNLIIKYQNSNIVEQINQKGKKVRDIVKLPIKKVRDFGWVHHRSENKNKIFWYAISEAKIVIVTKMRNEAKEKKVRVKQMPRIGNVVVNETSSVEKWNIGVIPYNFSKMIGEQIMPIITKKITQ